MKFIEHFVSDLSNVLTVHDHVSNPFREIILRMAMGDDENLALRHSLLSFAGLHLYGCDSNPTFNIRQLHHYQRAIYFMRIDCEKAMPADQSTAPLTIQDPMIATSIIQCLIAICRGSTDGEYRSHMNIIRRLISDHRSSDPIVQDFFQEFLMFHDIWNALTSLDRRPTFEIEENHGDGQPMLLTEPIKEAPKDIFIGVKDGLLKFIVRISKLRDTIRKRMRNGMLPIREYSVFMTCANIELDLKAWAPVQEPFTSSWYFALFNQKCIWVYLYRSIKVSKPSEDLTAVVDEALEYLQESHSAESTQSVLLSPLFILGCAAFQERQRPPIERAFVSLQKYSNLGNIRHARTVVQKVWELMDDGDERSWDWEQIMYDMGLDLLIT